MGLATAEPRGRPLTRALEPGALWASPLSAWSPPDDRSEQEGSSLSVLSAAASTGRLPPPERLREKAFQYCQRLVEQSTRRELGSGPRRALRGSQAAGPAAVSGGTNPGLSPHRPGPSTHHTAPGWLPGWLSAELRPPRTPRGS